MEFFASQEVWMPFCHQWRILSRECLQFWRPGGSWWEGGETPAETSKAVVIILERQTQPRTLNQWKWSRENTSEEREKRRSQLVKNRGLARKGVGQDDFEDSGLGAPRWRHFHTIRLQP